jgi:hypothetical protein
MFKCNILNQKQNLSWSASFSTQEEAQAWLDQQIGKPHRLIERVVSIDSEYDQDDVLEVIETEEERFDEEGNSLGMGLKETHVRLLPQFTSEIVDISAQVELEAQKAAARKLLAETDWLIIREMDSGVLCPSEIKLQRQAARELL